jgi:Flp pilus assembly protein TadB
MVKNLEQNLKDCEKFEKQRTAWLRISGFIAIVILVVIVDWSFVTTSKESWILFSSGITMALIWWYWTMMLIRRLLKHNTELAKILLDLHHDVKDIKKELSN